MSFEIKGLDDLINRFEKAEKIIPKELTAMTNLVGAEVLARTKNKTPVGESRKGYTGGTLRRNWKTRKLDPFTIVIYNNTKYAEYVEFGHRTRGGKGYVEGVYMLKRSVNEIIISKVMEKAFDTMILKFWG